jgi:hypothetical protein
MDATRFDTFTRSLTEVRSRRGALAALLGGTLGLLGLAETAAKKGKRKGKGNGKKKGRNPSPPPPPPDPSAPSPTCTDGSMNGSETDVDCGGSCPRCANGRRCGSRNDCASGRCGTDGTCLACTASGDCGIDGNGACNCLQPMTGGPKSCFQRLLTGASVTTCENCLAGTHCVTAANGQLYCVKPCGAA